MYELEFVEDERQENRTSKTILKPEESERPLDGAGIVETGTGSK
jgi:hypothetical protein